MNKTPKSKTPTKGGINRRALIAKGARVLPTLALTGLAATAFAGPAAAGQCWYTCKAECSDNCVESCKGSCMGDCERVSQ